MQEPREVLSRKERERLTRRSDILEIALRLLVEKGYHNVTMREIASEAGFATGTLYNYFEGKEALYAELVRTFTRTFVDVILATLDAEEDARQKISRYIRATIGLMADNAAGVELYYRQMQALPEAVRDPDGDVTRLRESAVQKLTGVFESGVRSGLFRDLPSQHAADCLIGVIEAIGSSGLGIAQGASADEVSAFVEDMFFRGVLREKRP